MSEKYQAHCIRPRSAERLCRNLNPRHFPQVREPAHGSGFPILGDFEISEPTKLGGWGASAKMFRPFQTSSKDS
jgi:hypothetical protein